MKAWPGSYTLRSLSSVSPLNSLPPSTASPLSLHPLFASPPSITPPSSPAVGDGFSESSWDGDQRQITADVHAKCNMELTPAPLTSPTTTPAPSHVLAIDFAPSL